MNSKNSNSIEQWWHQLKREAKRSRLEQQMNSVAVVVADIKPLQKGRIKYQATYWFGRCEDPVTLPKGTMVKVIRREGNTWVVRSIAS